MAPAAFCVGLVQAAPTLAAALLQGAFLQVLRALVWLVVDSVAGRRLHADLASAPHRRALGPLGGLLVFGLILFAAWKLLFLWLDLPTREIRQDAKRHARAQGRLSDAEILKKFGMGASTKIGDIEVATGVIPLGYIADKPIGIPWAADAGHIAVVGPTRSGKGLHLTDTLIRWPWPVVCIDPKGEQWQRGAGITMVLYAQALPQIEDVYGREAALSILSNCTSQLFFPPREPHTAELISRSSAADWKSLSKRHSIQSATAAATSPRWKPQR